jgi:hypothetical protein
MTRRVGPCGGARTRSCSSPSRAPRPVTRSPSPGRTTSGDTRTDGSHGQPDARAPAPDRPSGVSGGDEATPDHLGDAMLRTAGRSGWPPGACTAGSAGGRSQDRPQTASPNTARCWRTATPPSSSRPRGEELWTRKRGPKNASLEQCDLGKGPGVVKGAFVELPRFFADTGRVHGPRDAPGAPAWRRCRA